MAPSMRIMEHQAPVLSPSTSTRSCPQRSSVWAVARPAGAFRPLLRNMVDHEMGLFLALLLRESNEKCLPTPVFHSDGRGLHHGAQGLSRSHYHHWWSMLNVSATRPRDEHRYPTQEGGVVCILFLTPA